MTEQLPGDAHNDDNDSGHGGTLVLVVVFLLFVVGGVWLLMTMAEVRRVQDCTAQGRRNCEIIDNTPRPRQPAN